MSNNGTYTNSGFVDDNGNKGEKCAKYEKDKSYSVELAQKAAKGDGQAHDVSDSYDPYVHRKVSHPLTNKETLIHLLKIALGTGIFAMPNAFKSSGFVVGIVGTIIVGFITNYCVHSLVHTHYMLCKRNKVPSLTYPQIAEAALLAGPQCFRPYAGFMIHLVNAIILIYEIGSCSIYVVFIASNLKELIDYFCDTQMDLRFIMLMLLLPLIVINWIRNLKYLAPLSTVGTVATIISFGIILYYIFREPLTLEGKEAFGQVSSLPMFFGTVLFALEAIAVIMPLENEMKSPRDFVGTTGVLNRAMCLVIALYVGLGLCGYMKYGSGIRSSITLNLPQREPAAQAVKTLISCGIFISNAVVTQVAIDLAWTQYCVKRLKPDSNKFMWEYILRTSVVCITFLLAIAIPNLELFISLIGALTLSTLGLTIPAFLECCARWDSTCGMSRTTMIFKNCVIGILGVAALVIGTSSSIKEIIVKIYE